MTNNLRAIRQARGYTCKQVAEALDVTEMTISRYERDEERLRLPTLRSLAALFDCTVAQIIGEEAWPPEKPEIADERMFVDVIRAADGYLAEEGISLGSDERARLYAALMESAKEEKRVGLSRVETSVLRPLMRLALGGGITRASA